MYKPNDTFKEKENKMYVQFHFNYLDEIMKNKNNI